MVIMEGFKLAANGIYGKSGEESSFLYDPLYTMKTTIAGQLFLSMFTEKLVNACPEIKFIQHNTDGLTYLVKRSHLSLVKEVTKEMEDLTGLYIEDNIYNLLVMRDVNNYLAKYESGDIKYKGITDDIITDFNTSIGKVYNELKQADSDLLKKINDASNLIPKA